MKTKNNVQKAILKSLAVVTSLVLISINVYAQDLWKSLFDNYNFNEIEIAMVDYKTVANAAENGATRYESLLEQENEVALRLEDWMRDENNFVSVISIEEEFENTLKLEDWMTNEALFNATSIYLQAEAEADMELENWMTDENNFEVSTIHVIEETDTELKIEDWMLQEELFTTNLEIEQPLKLEAWMVSENIW